MIGIVIRDSIIGNDDTENVQQCDVVHSIATEFSRVGQQNDLLSDLQHFSIQGGLGPEVSGQPEVLGDSVNAQKPFIEPQVLKCGFGLCAIKRRIIS